MFELDFLAVGNGERSGDAIVLRWGNLNGSQGNQFVMVVDGGTQESGKGIVEHIRNYYLTDYIDLVVSTHPDADHASGLSVVLEEMEVGRLWMHRPWEHASEIRGLFKNGRITEKGLRETIRKSLEDARELETIANLKRIPIEEPFSDVGTSYQGIHIINPSVKFYEGLLPYFRETPEPKAEPSLLEKFISGTKEMIKRTAENWGIETLSDPEDGATSAENNSSVVLLLRIDGHDILLTGDAGVPALTEAAESAEKLGVNLQTLSFIQIPHHGSKRNVGPTILNRIVGPKKQQRLTNCTAFISASKEGEPKHPAKKVVNAFKRRGAEVYATQGITVNHRSNDAPVRWGWRPVTPLPFYEQVEE